MLETPVFSEVEVWKWVKFSIGSHLVRELDARKNGKSCIFRSSAVGTGGGGGGGLSLPPPPPNNFLKYIYFLFREIFMN